jgi:hypothetical protein
MAAPVALAGRDQGLDLGLSHILAGPNVGVLGTPWRLDFPYFGVRRDDPQYRFGHVEKAPAVISFPYNNHFTESLQALSYSGLPVICAIKDGSASHRP